MSVKRVRVSRAVYYFPQRVRRFVMKFVTKEWRRNERRVDQVWARMKRFWLMVENRFSSRDRWRSRIDRRINFNHFRATRIHHDELHILMRSPINLRVAISCSHRRIARRLSIYQPGRQYCQNSIKQTSCWFNTPGRPLSVGKRWIGSTRSPCSNFRNVE